MEDATVLITGAAGFTGRYVMNRALDLGCRCVALCHNSESMEPRDRCIVHSVDLLDRHELERVILELGQIDFVVHLGAVSFVAHKDVSAIYNTNLIGTLNLIQALVESDCGVCKVLCASSGNVYGETNELPLSESHYPLPVNDYAVSKTAMEQMLALRNDIDVVITRPFNYTGVGQSNRFLIPKIVSAFQRKASKLELGNLDVARDFSDVRDVAFAYLELLQNEQASGIYNICRGEAVSLTHVVERLAELSGHSLEVKVNPAFVRLNEIKTLYGSPSKLKAAIGEYQRYTFEETLAWMYWSNWR